MDLIDVPHRAVTVDCDTGNDFDSSKIGLRISAIFVIFITSTAGALLPLFLKRAESNLPAFILSIMKYFGSGVIIATAFIHLLAPATEALTSPCLTGPITEYSWAEGIVLMSIFVMFFIELLAQQYDVFGHGTHGTLFGTSPRNSDSPGRWSKELRYPTNTNDIQEVNNAASASNLHDQNTQYVQNSPQDIHYISQSLATSPIKPNNNDQDDNSNFSAQFTAMLILEFGVIFHSIFIGLTLAVTSNDEFNILYTVLVFHQTFEGLGLGSRLSSIDWPEGKKWMPWLFGIAFGLTTPIAIAIGLGVHESFEPDSQRAMITNGIFDSISAGILIYTGLIELLAREILFNKEMTRNLTREKKKEVTIACVSMVIGAFAMALLGRWA